MVVGPVVAGWGGLSLDLLHVQIWFLISCLRECMGMCTCICSCAFIHMLMGVQAHICVCVCEAREQLPVFVPQVPPSLTVAWNLAKLAGQKTPGGCLLLQNAGYECVPPLLALFMWVLGLSLRSFCLFSSHRPSPCLCPIPTQTLAAPAVVVCLILQTVPAALVSCRHCRGACPEKKLHCCVLAHLCLSFPHSEMTLAEVNVATQAVF